MTQVKHKLIEAEAMVRSYAWREGYASARRGDPPDFVHRGRRTLSYEYGRLTAAYLRGQGREVPWIMSHRPLPERLVPYFAEALLECAGTLSPAGR